MLSVVLNGCSRLGRARGTSFSHRMRNKTMNWINKLFCDANGVPDDARVAAFLLVLAFIGNSIYATVTGHTFDAQQFGVGSGALAAGIGGWFGFRKAN